jgi:UDP-N-acetylmuramate--alanine ligase
MHVYFSGVGGTGIGPLALVARQAGFEVSGSDKQHSGYIDYLKQHGVNNIHIGQAYEQMAEVQARSPIDWFVYTSSLPIEQPDAPELRFCAVNGIRATKRDEFLNFLLQKQNLKLVAVAGTHGKTTTTAMAIWLLKQLEQPVSYSVGAKLSFGDMGEFDPASEYFIYEADEFDRNFLAFHPHLSLITGIDWDHPDIYPTKEVYDDAFVTFLGQSDKALVWQSDASQLKLPKTDKYVVLDEQQAEIDQKLTLPGRVNRLDAWEVVQAVHLLTGKPQHELLEHINRFPGVSRRFEQIAPGVYSDYAHTPPKIRGALQLAHEVAQDNVIVIYEGLHNTRQHFIKDELKTLFDDVKQLYVIPSYLAREDPSLALLAPDDLLQLLSPKAQAHARAAGLDTDLAAAIRHHLDEGNIVLALSAGGGGSLDEWLRKEFRGSKSGLQ